MKVLEKKVGSTEYIKYIINIPKKVAEDSKLLDKEVVVNASKGGGFNIWVERMHNTIRHKTKTFRGFHGSIESAYALMKGIEIYYNFIKKHEALKGRTPSELAIPDLQFQTPNKWLELIKLSKY